MKHTHAGFTLIEILVVMVILAVLASVTSIGLNRGGQQRFSNTVEQSQQWLQRVSTEAILSGSIWGVTVNQQEFHAYVWNGEDWLESADVEAYVLPDNVRYSHTVEVDPPEDKILPHFTFLPTGQIIPTENIVVSNDDEQALLSWQESFSPEVIYTQ